MAAVAECRNLAIVDSLSKAESVFAKYKPEEIAVSVSGGADSDVVMDLCRRFDEGHPFRYCFFDTGLELNATKRHLDYLEERYGVKIERVRAYESVPTAVREYGQPFLSKHVSEQISKLQARGFDWRDAPYEELIREYPDAKDPLRWWTNSYAVKEGFKASMFNVNRNIFLKEFITAHPPAFKISSKCCYYAKKKTATKYNRENGIKLSVIGVRKAEGGIRAALKACFTDAKAYSIAKYRPIFWYGGADRHAYEEAYDIVHSDCYGVYGFVRTGCTGCPFNPRLFKEQEILQRYEPMAYRACQVVFKESYEYTRMYKEFVAEMKAKRTGQISLFEGG